MTKIKIIVNIILLIAFLILISGCSIDPLVTPHKIFILGEGSDRGRVLYEEEYNSRVVFLNIGETILLKAITNRLYEGNDFNWDSNVKYVSNVVKRNNNEAIVTALEQGISRIEVSCEDFHQKGFCFIVVGDKYVDDGFNIVIEDISGVIKAEEDKYEINSPTIEGLNEKKLNLSYENNKGYSIERVEWYVNGVLHSYGEKLSITFENFGSHTIDCIAYRKNGGSLSPVGTSSIDINVNNY